MWASPPYKGINKTDEKESNTNHLCCSFFVKENAHRLNGGRCDFFKNFFITDNY